MTLKMEITVGFGTIKNPHCCGQICRTSAKAGDISKCVNILKQNRSHYTDTLKNAIKEHLKTGDT